MLILAASTAPMLGATLSNYKPDYACGLLTAIACLFASAFNGPTPSARRLVIAGCAFGFAALAKPAALPFTLGMLGLCALVNMVSSGDESRLYRFTRSTKQFGVLLAGACLIAIPHFATGGWRTLLYSFEVLAGSEADTWRSDRSVIDHALYYLTGPGGRLMLGAQVWPLLAIGLVCCVLIVARKPFAPLRTPAIRVAILCIAELAVPTILPTKIAQFAATFHVLLWLGAFAGFAATVRHSSVRLQYGACAALLVVCFLTGQIHRDGNTDTDGPYAAGNDANAPKNSDAPERARPALARAAVRSEGMAILGADVISRARLSQHRSGTRHVIRVLILAGPGDMCPEYVWHLRFQSGVNLIASHLSDPSDDAAISKELKQAGYVWCTDGQSVLSVNRRTAKGANATFVERMRRDTRFRLARTIGVGAGNWFVYQRATDCCFEQSVCLTPVQSRE